MWPRSDSWYRKWEFLNQKDLRDHLSFRLKRMGLNGFLHYLWLFVTYKGNPSNKQLTHFGATTHSCLGLQKPQDWLCTEVSSSNLLTMLQVRAVLKWMKFCSLFGHAFIPLSLVDCGQWVTRKLTTAEWPWSPYSLNPQFQQRSWPVTNKNYNPDCLSALIYVYWPLNTGLEGQYNGNCPFNSGVVCSNPTRGIVAVPLNEVIDLDQYIPSNHDIGFTKLKFIETHAYEDGHFRLGFLDST